MTALRTDPDVCDSDELRVDGAEGNDADHGVTEGDELTGGDENDSEQSEPANSTKTTAGTGWKRILVFVLLPILAMALTLAAAFLKWQDESVRDAYAARDSSIQSARDATVALLSYQPDTAEKQLGAARELLTGSFKDAYTKLTHEVVIPGAKQKQISAVATISAAASVSANPHHAVVLVFIDQTVIVGNDAPTATSSAVRVSLDKVGNRWLVSKFDPV